LGRLNVWAVSLPGPQYRLTEYKYDDLGNLLDANVNGVSDSNLYGGPAPHQLTQRAGIQYSYDGRGRMYHSSAGLDITYTDFNLPSRITKQNGAVYDFKYDADHRRVTKSVQSGSTTSTTSTTVSIAGLFELRPVPGHAPNAILYVS